jgi:hypothetical protein
MYQDISIDTFSKLKEQIQDNPESHVDVKSLKDLS